MIMPDEMVSYQDFVSSLFIDFSSQDIIPLDLDEKNWRNWGNEISGSSTFAKAGCPRTDSFNNWREWAKVLYNRFG